MECVNGLLFTKAFTATVCLPPCSARFRSKGLSRSSAMHMPTWRARAMDALFHGAENSLAHAFSSRPQKVGPELNVALFDCSMNEDFVGRVARQSRRI